MWRIFTAVFLEALVISVAGGGAAWRLVGPGWEVTLPLPQGSAISPWDGALAVIRLPHPGGTTLRDLFLFLRLLSRPGGKGVVMGGHHFLFSHSWEGAAGTFYDTFAYALPLPWGGWLELSFVAVSVDPWVLDRPPPVLDPDALIPFFEGILRGLRITEGGHVPR